MKKEEKAFQGFYNDNKTCFKTLEEAMIAWKPYTTTPSMCPSKTTLVDFYASVYDRCYKGRIS